jgi:hypothetical protein
MTGDTRRVLRSAWQTPAPIGARTKLLMSAHVLTGWQWLRPLMRWSGRRDRSAQSGGVI